MKRKALVPGVSHILKVPHLTNWRHQYLTHFKTVKNPDQRSGFFCSPAESAFKPEGLKKPYRIGGAIHEGE